MKRLRDIMMTFLKIGTFTIGGGFAMIPLIQREVVDRHGWMDDEEFLDAVSLTNSLPGPLAVNAAAFVGYRVRGVPGAVIAALGASIPSVVIIMLIAMVFQNIVDYPVVQHVFSGVRPAVAALIFYALVKLSRTARIGEYFNWAVALAGFAAVAVFGVHPIFVVVAAGLYGLFLRGSVVRAVDAHRAAEGGSGS